MDVDGPLLLVLRTGWAETTPSMQLATGRGVGQVTYFVGHSPCHAVESLVYGSQTAGRKERSNKECKPRSGFFSHTAAELQRISADPDGLWGGVLLREGVWLYFVYL